MKHDIFISYSRRDLDIVRTVYERLVQEGFDVWIDMEGLYSGDQFKREITKAIINARVLIYFSSENANKSSWTASEIGVAREFRIPIMPVKLDTTPYSEEILLDLVNLNFTDYSVESERPRRLDGLVQSLKRLYPPSHPLQSAGAEQAASPEKESVAEQDTAARTPVPESGMQALYSEFEDAFLMVCNRYSLIPRVIRQGEDATACVRDICYCGATGIPPVFLQLSPAGQLDLLEAYTRDDYVRLALATWMEIRQYRG